MSENMIYSIMNDICDKGMSCTKCPYNRESCAPRKTATVIYQVYIAPLESALAKAEADKTVLVEALERLVETKDYKEHNGKDTVYIDMQSKVWEIARAALARVKGDAGGRGNMCKIILWADEQKTEDISLQISQVFFDETSISKAYAEVLGRRCARAIYAAHVKPLEDALESARIREDFLVEALSQPTLPAHIEVVRNFEYALAAAKERERILVAGLDGVANTLKIHAQFCNNGGIGGIVSAIEAIKRFSTESVKESTNG